MVKRLTWQAVLMLVVTLVGTGRESAPAYRQDHSENRFPNTLALTTSVKTKKFCLGDAEVAILQMNLGLRYTNHGKQPIILFKGSSSISSITLKETIKDSQGRDRELHLPFTVLSVKGRPITTLDNRFIILRAGSSFETETEVAIPFTTIGETIPGTVRPGRHSLKISVVTWPESPELARKLRISWRRRGHLWDKSVESAPMEFTIEDKPTLQACE